MKNTILALAVFAMLASCKKNAIKDPEIEKKNLPKDIEVAVTGTNTEVTPSQQPSETYNYLGYGYDVTAQYEDASSVRATVFDAAIFAAKDKYAFSLSRSTQSYWKRFTAIDAADLSKQFSYNFEDIKGLSVFGNTLPGAFPQQDLFNKKYVYGYYSYVFEWKTLWMFFNYNTDYKSISSTFIQDVNVLSAENLVKKYGTHVLTKINMGAKFNAVYQAEVKAYERKKIAIEGLRYAMRKTFGLPTGELDDVVLEDLNANLSAKVYFYATGGDGSKLKINKETKWPTVNITDWLHGSTYETAKFIGVAEKGIKPLYDFIGDETKKAEVKDYITKYIAAREVKLSN